MYFIFISSFIYFIKNRIIIVFIIIVIYFISLKGTTGSEKFNPIDVRENIKHLNEISTLPVVIGFGIKDKETVESIKDLSDGVVVGSALVDLLGTKGFGTDIKEKVNELSSALAD